MYQFQNYNKNKAVDLRLASYLLVRCHSALMKLPFYLHSEKDSGKGAMTRTCQLQNHSVCQDRLNGSVVKAARMSITRTTCGRSSAILVPKSSTLKADLLSN